MEELLNVQDLETQFLTSAGEIHIVNGISFTLKSSEILAIIGETGCGKSVAMLSILRLLQQPPGKIKNGKAFFNGKDLLSMTDQEVERVRTKKIGMVLQHPNLSSNTGATVGKMISDTLMSQLDMSKSDAQRSSIELLHQVGIPEAKNRMDDLFNQYSDGMRQRVMIAKALANKPGMLILDSPTMGMDVILQAQVCDLIKQYIENFGVGVIWITHDLGVIAGLAQRVEVMCAGYIIEEANVKTLYSNPQHPYTLGLLGCLPRLNIDRSQRLNSIPGVPPVLNTKPTSCPFQPRCRYSINLCKEKNPSLVEVGTDHQVACWVDPLTGRERS